MNVYVVSLCWWREGATVIGAAVDRAGAEQIAERHDTDDPSVASWGPWKEWASPAEGSGTWHRDALLSDGTVHLSLYQEIVVVPLAGFTFASGGVINGPVDTLRGARRAVADDATFIAEIGRTFGAP